ncbi:MAG: hypothetical protein QOC60_930 [Frankiaceae bacterium]|nr:hypothetical protein [Frankiaceae bacterium]
MIDFRYHIVSIVAVFLALALGLVLGTVAIDPLIVRDLKGQVTKLVNDKSGLQGDVESLRAQAANGTAFARAATVPLVKDQLAGRSLVVVSLPGVPAGMRDDMLGLLDQAGAHVTARVTLSDRYADPTQDALLEATVTAATPAGVILSGTTPSQRAGELLASVLTRRTDLPSSLPSSPSSTPPTAAGVPSIATHPTRSASATVIATASPTRTPTPVATPPEPVGTISRVLEAYRTAGLLSIDAQTTSSADLVLVLTPEGPADGQLPPTVDVNRYLDVLGALAGVRRASVVMAGPTSSVAGGLIAHLRGSGAANLVSSVDAAETPYGLVATVRALRARLFGTVGRFGVAAGDVPLPQNAETP